MGACRLRWRYPRGAGERGTSERGYTLIEAVMAIAVVSVGLLGVFQTLASTLDANSSARKRSFATHFAEQKLEEMRNEDFSNVTTTEDNTDPELHENLGRESTRETALWSMYVEDVSPTLKAVTLTVEWEEGQGKTESVSLYTLAERAGIGFIRYKWANGASGSVGGIR